MTIPRPKTAEEVAEEMIPEGTTAGIALRAIAVEAIERYIDSIFAFKSVFEVGQRVEYVPLRGEPEPAVIIRIEKHTSARHIPVIRKDATGEERGINPDVLRSIKSNGEKVFVDGYGPVSQA